MQETYTLLVWAELPENVRFFVIPNKDITPDVAVSLKNANGYYRNSRNDDKVVGLWDWLFDDDGECKHPEYEVEVKNGQFVTTKTITRVCSSGFYL